MDYLERLHASEEEERGGWVVTPLDLDRLRAEVISQCGQQWWDRYGEASLAAALVTFGEVPADEVESYINAWLADPADGT